MKNKPFYSNGFAHNDFAHKYLHPFRTPHVESGFNTQMKKKKKIIKKWDEKT